LPNPESGLKAAGSLALVALLALLTACGGHSSTSGTSMAVGAAPDPESTLLANVYAAALRSYGTPAHVETLPVPLSGLDSGQVSVVPGFTGRLLQTFAPGTSGTSDEQVYKAMVGTLPEGVAAGDYTTAAEDKPSAAVTATTAAAWGGHEVAGLAAHCGQLSPGAVKGARTPTAVGKCTLPAAREFPDDAALFDALRRGQVNVAWTTTADPAVPADVVVLADPKPMLIQAENVVPLYRRNGLSAREVLAVNEVAGVLDTATLKQMQQQVAGGTDPRAVAEGWLADNPLGR
jgi:glycine betaine/choline ABC-type transport system substrate-binding protein